jgi:cytochrome c
MMRKWGGSIPRPTGSRRPERGRIEVLVDSPTAPFISTANIPVTGGWQTYTDVTAPVTDPDDTHELFFVFLNNPGVSGLFNINRIDLNGEGAAQ